MTPPDRSTDRLQASQEPVSVSSGQTIARASEAHVGEPKMIHADQQTVTPELTIAAIAERIRARSKQSSTDPKRSGRPSPFARSSISESIGKPSLLSSGRPFSRDCYTNTPHKAGNDVELSSSDHAGRRRKTCYTNMPHNRLVGVVIRDGRYYFRRRVPVPLRTVIGRSEIWRSFPIG